MARGGDGSGAGTDARRVGRSATRAAGDAGDAGDRPRAAFAGLDDVVASRVERALIVGDGRAAGHGSSTVDCGDAELPEGRALGKESGRWA